MKPPRLSSTVLELLLPTGVVGRSILGDLAEEFGRRVRREGPARARRWYRREALGVLARVIMRSAVEDRRWAKRARSANHVVEAKGDPMIRQWWREIGQAVRSLGRAPGFTGVTVVTLGLAIGANTAVYSVVDGVLLEPLPFAEADDLVAIKSTSPGNNAPPEYGVSPEFYVAYRGNAPSLADVALYSEIGGTIRIDGAADRVQGAEVTVDFFETLGAEPLLGRLPRTGGAESLSPMQQPTANVEEVVISHAFWTQRFAGDPGVIGRRLDFDDRGRTIVGVMAPGLRLPDDETALWLPFEVDPDRVPIGQFQWTMVGRMTQGSESTEVQRELAALVARLPEQYPSPMYANFLIEGQYSPVVRPLKDELVGDLERPLWILLGTVGVVLLIACANVANLFLVRIESKQRDMAVRIAMGAGRAALIRRHMAEAVVLAAVGGVLGVGLARVGVPALLAAAPDGMPRLSAVELDAGVLSFAAALSLASALLFGLAAAVRYSSPAMLTRLRYAGRGSIGRERHLTRSGLVVIQSALALVLLVGSGLLVRSFAELMDVDPGFESAGVLSFRIALPSESYDSAGMARFHVSLIDRLSGLPGVQSVGAVQQLPLDQSSRGTAFEFEEAAPAEGPVPPIAYFTHASQGYFEAMGIAVTEGRSFVRADQETDLGNVVVSRSVAERNWPGESAIGKRLRMAGDTTGWDTVVGVVDDVRDADLRDPSRGLVYMPLVGRPGEHAWSVPSPAFVVKAENPRLLIPAVRDEIRRLDAGLPIYEVRTMQDVVSASVVRLSFTMMALGVSSFLALVLGAIGLYGVLSYLVSQRTQEIGVRLALGARASQVRAMVVRQGTRLAIVGMVGGLAAAAGLTSVLQGLLYGTEPLDAVTFVAMSAVMLIVGLLASYLPARRASSVDPIESIRVE